jgi:hypothetical protein
MFIAGVVDTGGKLFSGVHDTGEKFIAGVHDTSDKFFRRSPVTLIPAINLSPVSYRQRWA